jgi:putative ABC transport system ATP-binding protein
MLAARGLLLDYSGGGSVAHAVNGVSMEITKGSFTGVIGPSGSGKSSLMYLLSGLKRPTRGEVVFEGRGYDSISTRGLMRLRRERFGFIFQQHFLINYLTVLENAMVGALVRDEQTLRRARELLDRVGLGQKLEHRPYQLSIGERQRAAVVRALVHRPTVVFADEPTASLDQATGREVVGVLMRYQKEENGSIVVVTHDPAMLEGADQILQMRDGRLFTTSPN